MATSPTDPDLVVVVTDASSGSDGSSEGSDDGSSDGEGSGGGGSDSGQGGDSSGGDSSGDGSGGDGSGGDGSDKDSEDKSKNALEWLVFGLGLAITLGVIGYLGYQVAFGSDEPADVRIALDVGVPSADGSTAIVPVEVSNEGDHVAEGVVVEVCAGPEACGEVSFPYVPKGSTRQGSVGLSLPLEAPLSSRVVSYRKP